jgi:hypothetical protein
MDVFLHFNFHHKSLAQINSCRIYLQILSVSDITSADGKTLLASAIAGVRDTTRTSTLTWPNQVQPTEPAWQQWRVALQYISTRSKLHQPLGSWTSIPHQLWEWFAHRTLPIVYRKHNDNSWLEFHPIPTSGPLCITHQTKIWYALDNGSPSSPNTHQILPTTLHCTPPQSTDRYYSAPSSSTFPLASSSSPNSLWPATADIHAFVDTPEFFQRLIGPSPVLDESITADIATHIETGTLLTCSDGSFTPDTGTGSHG